MNCACDERFKIDEDGTRHRYPEGEWTHLHDCSYVRKRNALIEKAEQSVIDSHGTSNPGARFTRLFANRMNQLAKEAKLT